MGSIEGGDLGTVSDNIAVCDTAVTSEELVRAVHAILVAAGVPPSVEATELLTHTLCLKEELGRVAAARDVSDASRASLTAAVEATAKAFCCPVTQSIMRDPVTAADGHSYERASIARWFSQGKTTSPVTNLRLTSLALVPNHALRAAITTFEHEMAAHTAT